nr:hypothetical protein [Candidatus Sigynarchaeota archaeon]
MEHEELQAKGVIDRKGKIDTEQMLLLLYRDIKALTELAKPQATLKQQLETLTESTKTFGTQVDGLASRIESLNAAIAATKSGLDDLASHVIPDLKAELASQAARAKTHESGLVKLVSTLEDLIDKFQSFIRDEAIQVSKERSKNLENSVKLLSFLKLQESMNVGSVGDELAEKLKALSLDIKASTAVILNKFEDILGDAIIEEEEPEKKPEIKEAKTIPEKKDDVVH